MAPKLTGWRKGTFQFLDVMLFLWFIGGFIWLSVLSVQRGLQDTADEAQQKLKTITYIAIPWIGVLFLVGVPYLFLSVRYGYEPFWTEVVGHLIHNF